MQQIYTTFIVACELQPKSSGRHAKKEKKMIQNHQSQICTTWPIHMQLDLQSVEKVPFSTFSLELLPRKCWKFGLPRRRMTWNFLQDLSGAVPGFFGGPVAGNHRQHLLDPTGSNTITIPHRIEKKRFFSIRSGMVTQFDRKSVDGDFLQLGPRRSGEQLWIDLGQNSKSF